MTPAVKHEGKGTLCNAEGDEKIRLRRRWGQSRIRFMLELGLRCGGSSLHEVSITLAYRMSAIEFKKIFEFFQFYALTMISTDDEIRLFCESVWSSLQR